ncbi:MAG: hypothetical protein FGM37_00110 [Phycisphaerales bacterium]|nr:hypothetical protein [Phycisphaerales bacterium]
MAYLEAMRDAIVPWRIVSSLVAAAACGTALAGSVPTTTVIVHGFSPSGKGAWVQATASAVIARVGGQGTVYRYQDEFGAWTRVPGIGNGSADHIVLIFNWDADSGGAEEGPNLGYVQAAGDALHATMRDATYAPGSSGPADLVTGRASHFIGHSRGACLISEAILRLGVAGIAVDQMTTLDPHPVNGTLDARYNLNWGDPVPQRWSNVAWADNYWRADGGGLLNGLDFDGMPLDNVLNVQLSESLLNCCAYSFSHSDVHLWYFGTISLATGASNGEETVTAQMRSSWWPEGAANVGFARSAIGGAARPTISPGIAPNPALAPILHNGNFVGGTRAGWAMHGGSGATLQSESGNWFARLSSARPQLTHNRSYLPAPRDPSRPVQLSMAVRRSGAAGSGDALRVEIQGAGDETATPVPGASWPVSSLGTSFAGVTVPIPPELCGMTARLHVVLDGGGNGIASNVDIDDIVITVPPRAADLNGDLRVDGTDLGALLAAWGPCSGCPADINGDGSVNAIDLAALLAALG